MVSFMTRYPILVDARVLGVAVALVLALVGFVASGDPAAAGGAVIGGGPRHGG